MSPAVCVSEAQLGPLRPAYATAQLVAFALACGYIVVATVWFIVLRWRNPRSALSKRSLGPLVLTSIGTIFIIMTRTSYDYLGRNFFACSFSTMLVYMAIPLVAINDVISFQAYVYQLQRRSALSKHNAEQAQVDDSEEFGLGKWFRQLNDYLQVIVFLAFKDPEKQSLPLNIPARRLVSFEIAAWLSISIWLFIAGIVRVYTEPEFNPANGCTACRLGTTDLWMLLAATIFALPQLFIHYYATRNLPDPLGLILMGVLCGAIGALFGVGAIALVVYDPGAIMEQQLFDWFHIEHIMYLILFTARVPLAIYRNTNQHVHPRNVTFETIRLADCLDDPTVTKMLQETLKAELASENLEFYLRAIAWKANFKEGESSTQLEANFIISTFIGEDSNFPINISDTCVRQILKLAGRRGKYDTSARQTSGYGASSRSLAMSSRRSLGGHDEQPPIPIFVFEEAVHQVFQLIEFGAFMKIKLSEEFKEWAASTERRGSKPISSKVSGAIVNKASGEV